MIGIVQPAVAAAQVKAHEGGGLVIDPQFAFGGGFHHTRRELGARYGAILRRVDFAFAFAQEQPLKVTSSERDMCWRQRESSVRASGPMVEPMPTRKFRYRLYGRFWP